MQLLLTLLLYLGSSRSSIGSSICPSHLHLFAAENIAIVVEGGLLLPPGWAKKCRVGWQILSTQGNIYTILDQQGQLEEIFYFFLGGGGGEPIMPISPFMIPQLT